MTHINDDFLMVVEKNRIAHLNCIFYKITVVISGQFLLRLKVNFEAFLNPTLSLSLTDTNIKADIKHYGV